MGDFQAIQDRHHPSGNRNISWVRPRAPTLIVAAICLGAVAGALSGCYRPILTDEETRSQFDSYDRVRNRLPPRYRMDEFGNRKPNLADRLMPRD